MYIDKYKNETIVTSERGKFLKLKEVENSEELLGKPERIIFSNKGNIPEFEELDLIEEEEK